MIHSDESTSILHELCPIQPDTVYHEDCLEGMKRIPDGSVDLILCDLPYGTTQYRWDSVIPTDLLFSEYRRILKPNGTFLLFGSEPFSTLLRMQDLKLYKYDWVWEKDNVTGFADAKNKPMKRHELISVFSKGSTGHKGIVPEGRRMTYNPQGLVYLGDTETGGGAKKPTTAVLDGVEYSHRSGKICKTGRFPTARPNAESKKKIHTDDCSAGEYILPSCADSALCPPFIRRNPISDRNVPKGNYFQMGGGTEGGLVGTYHNKQTTYLQEYTNYPTSILHFAKDKCNKHPSQKPLALLEYLIRTYSNEYETVLDNCMGSGSTAIASLNTNRHFIGFELNPYYYQVCQERIAAYVEYRRKHGHGSVIENYADVEWNTESGIRREQREVRRQAQLEQRRQEAAQGDFFGIPFSELTADSSEQHL